MKQSEYISGDWVKASGQLCRVEEVFVNRLTKEYEFTIKGVKIMELNL